MQVVMRGWQLVGHPHRRAAVTVGALIGVWLGVGLALGVAGRRMDTVVARNLTALRSEDVSTAFAGLAGSGMSPRSIARLPQVVGAVIETFPIITSLRSPTGVQLEQGEFEAFAPGPVLRGVGVDRFPLDSGHMPVPGRPDQVVIELSLARRLHVGLGQTLMAKAISVSGLLATFAGRTPSAEAPIPLHVVGIGVDNSVGAVARMLLDSAFLQTYPRSRIGVLQRVVVVRLRHGVRDVAPFELALRQLPHGRAAFVYPSYELADSLAQSLQVRGRAQEILALTMVVAAALALGLYAARMTEARSEQLRLVRSFGATPHQRFALALAPGALATAVSIVCAVVVEALASPALELGGARSFEPGSIPRLDLPVTALAVGAAILATLVATASSARSWTTRTPSAGGDRYWAGRVPSVPGVSPLPLPILAGGRLALAGGRTGGVAMSTRVAAQACALALATAGAVTYASIDHLVSTPRLAGQDYNLLAATTTPDALHDVLARPGVRAATEVEIAPAVVDGQPVSLAALVPVKGSIPLALLAGHAPRNGDEVAVGTATMGALGTSPGRTIRVIATTGSRAMRVVGQVVLPTVEGPTGLVDAADGMVVDEAGAHRLLGAINPARVLLRVSPGQRRRLLANQDYGAPQPPPELLDVRAVRAVAVWNSIAFGVAALLLLGYSAGAVARRRVVELALLRTFGFSPRQVLATVSAAAAWPTVLALVGLPLGLALGRLVWDTVAAGLGVKPVGVAPLPTIGLMIPTVLLLAILLALWPALTANRRATASLLRFGE